VTDLSIPGLKSARRMIDEIAARFGGDVKPRAIVNKYNKPLFSTGLSTNEVKQVLGPDLAGYVNANDSLVREAIDRGVPTTAIKARNSVIADVRKILEV
jgi:Flp pilus assembly CpaE family ATPase